MLCLQRKGSPELLHDTELEGCGCGVYLFLNSTVPLVIQSRSMRAAELQSLYVDRFGEPDPGLRRGVALYASRERTLEFVRSWLSCAWDLDTTAHCWTHGVHLL